ncbi:hypothetical protein Hanom_Chr08g00737731 [Helianthus anomalus]
MPDIINQRTSKAIYFITTISHHRPVAVGDQESCRSFIHHQSDNEVNIIA